MDTYKFLGAKDSSDGTNRVIVEGTAADPVRYADKGELVEMSESEVQQLRDQGLKFSKASEDAATQAEQDQNPGEIKSHEDQIAAQGTSGAQGPPAPGTDNPGGRSVAGKK